MRKSKLSALIAHGLFVIFISYAGGVMAGDIGWGQEARTAEDKWLCDYTRAVSDVLYIRCDNLASLMHDPLITDEPEQSVTKFIPIWRRPSSDISAARLAKAVLCDQNTACDAQMKSLFSAERLVNR